MPRRHMPTSSQDQPGTVGRRHRDTGSGPRPELVVDPFGAWLSRELHDRVGQSMAVAIRMLELSQAYAATDPALSVAKQAAGLHLARQALEELQGVVSASRRSAGVSSLTAGLRSFSRLVAPAGTTITVSCQGDESTISALIREELFLGLRECLANAVRHASADRISVVVTVSDDAVVGVVADDGRGTARLVGPDHGLRLLAERMSLLGGTVALAGGEGRGTRVEIRMPRYGKLVTWSTGIPTSRSAV